MFFESSTHLPPNMNYGIRMPVEPGGIQVEDEKVSSTRQSTVLVFVTSLGGRMEENWRKVKNDIYQVNLVYK